MAEIELSALVRQCLNRRIPDMQTLDAESQAWAKERNEKVVLPFFIYQQGYFVLSKVP